MSKLFVIFTVIAVFLISANYRRAGAVVEPSCSVNLTPDFASFLKNKVVYMTASVNVINGTVAKVDFTSSNSSIAFVHTPTDYTYTYNTGVSGMHRGYATITANVTLNGSSQVYSCSDSSQLRIGNPQ